VMSRRRRRRAAVTTLGREPWPIYAPKLTRGESLPLLMANREAETMGERVPATCSTN
jgi:hypothetical protein